MTTQDRYLPSDIKALLGITSASALRDNIKAGKVPKPDVVLSQKTRYWYRATLVKAGLLPDAQAMESSQSAHA